MTEDKIEFFAKCGKWIAVKKLKVEGKPPLEVARFLASVHETLDRKMWEYMGDDIPLEKMDAIAYELTGAKKKGKKWVVSRKSEEETNAILAKLKSPAITRKIGEHVKSKELKNLARIYLTRRVFELLGVSLEPEAKLIEKYSNKKELAEP